jgi:hypothetical protein
MTKVAVIGAGPAGLMTAICISKNSNLSVNVFERNKSAGKKLLLTGNGRCNVTSGINFRDFINKYYDKGKFLYSSFYRFSNQDLIDFFEELGVRLKYEGIKIYPVSNKANDIRKALVDLAITQGVKISYNTFIEDINIIDDKYIIDGNIYDVLVLSTGGMSYKNTGSDGTGYKIAKSLGHTIVTPEPVLAPLKTDVIKELQGLSLDVNVDFLIDGKSIGTAQGGLIFTHYGLSGPSVLDISYYYQSSKHKQEIKIKTFDKDEILHLLQSSMDNNQSKTFKNIINNYIPKRFVEFLLPQSLLDKECANISKKELDEVTDLLSDFKMRVHGRLGFNEAMVTKGGVSLNEVNPKNMHSLIQKNLFIVGEMLDLTGQTGGYNLQAAFSTGYVAGEYIASKF